ncbi:MAG: hypothetical protein R2828_17360 [Saprospiraceae bacterium]
MEVQHDRNTIIQLISKAHLSEAIGLIIEAVGEKDIALLNNAIVISTELYILEEAIMIDRVNIEIEIQRKGTLTRKMLQILNRLKPIDK